MGLKTLQSHLLALSGAHNVPDSHRFMTIRIGRKKEFSEYHLYNKLATEFGITALTINLLYNFCSRIYQHKDSGYLWSLAAVNR